MLKIKLLFLLAIATNGFAMLSKKEVDEFHPYEPLKNRVVTIAQQRIIDNDFDNDEAMKNIMRERVQNFVLHEKRNFFADKIDMFFGLPEKEASENITLSANDETYIEDSINTCIKNYIDEEDIEFKKLFSENNYQEKKIGECSLSTIQINRNDSKEQVKKNNFRNKQKTLVTKHIEELFKKAEKLVETYEQVFLKQAENEAKPIKVKLLSKLFSDEVRFVHSDDVDGLNDVD